MENSPLQCEVRLALGCMGLTSWAGPDQIDSTVEKKAIHAFEAALISGITLYDHADIYGGGACESVFKTCLAAFPEARHRIQIWTKGGIGGGFYTLTAPYLERAIDASLVRLGIEQIDLYQLHRPDMLAHPAETAKALNAALKSGKIRAVGVSNYFPEQTRALQKYLDAPILSNQIQLNALRPVMFYEGWEFPPYHGSGSSKNIGRVGTGTLDFLMGENIVPLAFSPLAKAELSKSDSVEGPIRDVQDCLGELALKYDATRTQIALSWLLTHPSGIIPIVGSNNPTHIFEAAQKNDLRLSHEEWYSVFKASWGRSMP